MGSQSEVHLLLRISDLIEGKSAHLKFVRLRPILIDVYSIAFIQEGICLGSIPAFNRKFVDDIVSNLAQEQWYSAIMK